MPVAVAAQARGEQTLGKLLGWAVDGREHGKCCLCGLTTTHGHAKAFSSKFTQYSVLVSGTVVCEHCYCLLKTQELRRRCWVALRGRVKYFTKPQAIRNVLLKPPAPPFAVYITRGKQVQGWLPLVRFVSTSRLMYYVGTDWLPSPALVQRDDLVAKVRLADRLRRNGVPLAVMLGEQQPSPRLVALAIKEGWLQDINMVRNLGSDPTWQIAATIAAEGKQYARTKTP